MGARFSPAPVLAALCAAVGGASAAAAERPCPPATAVMVVDTAAHRLFTCEGGRATAAYTVALGSGGVGKQRQGDAKVPLGDYALGAPRGSAQFHTFIPVGYPTAAQRRAGYTGSAIGVHGPARGWEKLPAAVNTATDWTLGCIAVGSDDEIRRIARWVRARRVDRIVIR